MALIDEGFVPELRTQGSYDSRLADILDLPRGGVVWHFYQTNIVEAKAAIQNTQCIVARVPQSILSVGKIEEVEAYVRSLVRIAGKDGGLMITSPGALGKDAKTDNVIAMVKAIKQYGVYQ